MSWKSKRRSIGRRDGWACVYCDKPLSEQDATLDHVVPRAMGGRNINANLVLSCRLCNHRKGNVTPLAYVLVAAMFGSAA